MNWKIYILVSPAQTESALYQAWIPQSSHPYVFVTELPTDWKVPDDAGLIISHQHFRWEYAHKLWEIYEVNQVPILILADGILEYRNIYQNPKIDPATFYQPVFGHKIACLGPSQARFIDLWGNKGKCEVVGIPRLDKFRQTNEDPPNSGGATLLITSANTPFFSTSDEKKVLTAFRHIHEFSIKNPIVNNKKVQYRWRVHSKIQQMLNLNKDQVADGALLPHLRNANGVITSPSTIFIESSLLQRPSALIDYSNSPSFLQSAWHITSRGQIKNVIRELLDPPSDKMDFQDKVLSVNYNLESLATESLLKLIDNLISCRDKAFPGRKLVIPNQILRHPYFNQTPTLETILPDPTLPDTIRALKSQLKMAHLRMGQFPEEIHQLRTANHRLRKKLQEGPKRNE